MRNDGGLSDTLGIEQIPDFFKHFSSLNLISLLSGSMFVHSTSVGCGSKLSTENLLLLNRS